MKSKSGIVMALALSLAVAGSVFAGVKTQNDTQSGSAAAAPKMTSKAKTHKTRKHRKTKHAKTMKSAKTTTPSTKK